MKTPDTNKTPNSVDVDGMNNNTPDTEWEKEFEHLSVSNLLREKDPTYGEENRRAKQQLKTFITKTLTSRDTYWKERVGEVREKYNGDVGACMCDDGSCVACIREEQNITARKALDTLLESDNLK